MFNINNNIANNHVKLIKLIRDLTCLTQHDFDTIYIKTINNFIAYVNNNPIIHKTLTQVIFAMRKRQAYLLPIGSESERSFREREEWTFAVFTAALCHAIAPALRQTVIRELIPCVVFTWLQRNTELFSTWQSYLTGDKQDNIFAEIIDQHFLIAEDDNCPNSFEQDFWTWLKNKLAKREIIINEEGSFIQMVDLGFLIVVPESIDLFLQSKNANTDLTASQQRDAVIANIIQHQNIILNQQRSPFHVYCIGQWQARKTLTGIIIKEHVLLDDSQIITVNPLLSPDPLASV